MKALVNITRVIVGVLFIFSGLIKANDPLGLAYKMDEYFAVWNWDWATPFSLYLSVGMNIFEILAGIAILLGFMPRLFTWLLLLLIIFFTFLTGYAVFSGKIKTCGCFGDCIPLEAYQSFIKDLILLGLILILFFYHKLIKPFLPARVNLILLLFFVGVTSFGQVHVIQNLPFVDCLPYAKNKNLATQMQAPAGSIPDSVVIMYKYQKAGKDVSFDANNFPEDFDETTYTYIGRENQVVRKGNAVPPIQDFALFAKSGTDTTQAILGKEGHYLLFFAKDYGEKQPAWLDLWGKIYLKSREKSVPIFIVTNQPVAVEIYFNQKNNFKVPVLTCDGTVMKTMLRSKVGIVAMKGAVVQQKWPEKKINDIVKYLNNLETK